MQGAFQSPQIKTSNVVIFFLIIKVLSMLYRLSLLSSVHFETFMTIRRWEWKLMTSRLHRNSDFIPSNLRFWSFTLSCEVLCFLRVETCLCIFEFALINDREFYLLQSSLLSWTNRRVDPILLFLCKIF